MKQCERCKNTFECRTDNIAACQCSQIRLDTTTQQILESTYFDCLCFDCLALLNEKVIQAKHLKAQSGNQLLPNQHYYIENGKMVFTELFLLQRGYCCRSGCRHCPYGFVSKM